MGGLLLRLAFGPPILWGAFALWIDGPSSRPLAGALALGFLGACVAVLGWLRPTSRALVWAAVLFAAVVLWWLSIPARNDRRWLPDVARIPRATVEGRRVVLQNVRNFRYRSEADFEERWEERAYDLDRLRGVDLFLSYWGSRAIAHTILSWEFDGAPPLAISIETRKEVGESYSAVRGFFRQYELAYVAGDERDLIGVRASLRGERIYLYPLKIAPDGARAFLLDYLEEVNRLADEPRWYNALTTNCTTTIRWHLRHIAPGGPWDWRILLNGRLDALVYERGGLDTTHPFEELRERSEITERAKAAVAAADFSARIREGLPLPLGGRGSGEGR